MLMRMVVVKVVKLCEGVLVRDIWTDIGDCRVTLATDKTI